MIRLYSFRNCIVALFAAALFAAPASAQNGVVDLKRVCGESAAYKQVQKQWNAIVQQKTQELSSRCSKIDDANRRQQLTEEYNNQLRTRQQSFFAPVSAEIQKATAAVAQERNLQTVYDIAAGQQGIDITNAVIAKLSASAVQKTETAASLGNAELHQPKKTVNAVVSEVQNNAVLQVQFGASRDKDSLKTDVAKAVKLGFQNAYICEASDKTGRKIWRARIPAKDKTEAQQISAKLTQQKISNFITK